MNKVIIFLLLIFSQVSIAQTMDTKQPVDLNKDGLITSAEIIAAIDAFFEGDAAFTSAEIIAAIDVFFEGDVASEKLSDTTKTSAKVANAVSQSKASQTLTDRFQSFSISKDSTVSTNTKTMFNNNFASSYFDLKEKADLNLKGKKNAFKNNFISQKYPLVSDAKSKFSIDSAKTKSLTFAKKQVKEFSPKGFISLGYEHGVLPSLTGNMFQTSGYTAQGQVGFMLLNMPLNATFQYTNLKNVVGMNNYFRISYDANQYKDQLTKKLNAKDQLTQASLNKLQLQKQQLLEQMGYGNMLNQNSFDNLNINDLQTNRLSNNLGSVDLNSLTDTTGIMNKFEQYASTNGLSQLSTLKDSSAFNNKDSIATVIAQNKAKYDSINKMIIETKAQLDKIKNLQNNPNKLTNPYLSKAEQFMSHIKKLEIGLCNPTYSTFLINNVPLQGINVEYEKNEHFIAITYGTTLDPLLFNTNTLQGTIQGARNLYNYFDFGNLVAGRKIFSVKGGAGLKDKTHLYVGMLVGKGKTDHSHPSIDPSKTKTESNVVLEIDGKYEFTENVSLDIIFGKSSVKEEDVTMEQIKKSINEIFSNYRSNAFLARLNAGIKKTNTKLTFSTRWVDPYFNSFGLSFLRSDNLRYEVKVEQPITKRIKYTVSYRREEDNLLQLVAYKNTLQSINNSLNIRLKKGFTIYLNYAPLFKEFKSPALIRTDRNNITTAIVSYVPKMKKASAQFKAIYNRYIITGDSLNINFENYTYTHQFQFKSGLKTGFSNSWFKNNLKDTLNNNTILSIVDVGYSTEKGNSFTVGAKVAYKKTTNFQYGFIAKATIKIYKGLFFESESEKIIIGDYYNPEMIANIKSFPFYFSSRLIYNF